MMAGCIGFREHTPNLGLESTGLPAATGTNAKSPLTYLHLYTKWVSEYAKNDQRTTRRIGYNYKSLYTLIYCENMNYIY